MFAKNNDLYQRLKASEVMNKKQEQQITQLLAQLTTVKVEQQGPHQSSQQIITNNISCNIQASQIDMNEVDNFIEQQEQNAQQSAVKQSGFPFMKSQGILDQVQNQNVPCKKSQSISVCSSSQIDSGTKPQNKKRLLKLEEKDKIQSQPSRQASLKQTVQSAALDSKHNAKHNAH